MGYVLSRVSYVLSLMSYVLSHMGYVLSHIGHVLPHLGHVLSHWVTCYHIWVFSHRCSVLRLLFRTPHGLLGYQRSSALFRPVCLSLTCLSPDSQSDCLRFFSPPHPPSFVDSLDSELWYRSGCRAAALASSSTEAVGQSFRQLFTTRSALQG